jgi:hypothetical protein
MIAVGDVIELVAGVLLVSAAWLAGGDAAALGTAGVFAFYEAQVYAGSPLTLRRRQDEDE